MDLDSAGRVGVPYGSRTRVAAVKGRCPRPLDERDAYGEKLLLAVSELTYRRHLLLSNGRQTYDLFEFERVGDSKCRTGIASDRMRDSTCKLSYRFRDNSAGVKSQNPDFVSGLESTARSLPLPVLHSSTNMAFLPVANRAVILAAARSYKRRLDKMVGRNVVNEISTFALWASMGCLFLYPQTDLRK